jgi:hypothetical protein
MSRPFFVVPFLAFTLQVSQAQLSSHGAPASATSPTADGRQHGVPATVLSPTPLPPGVHAPLRSGVVIHGPARRFGSRPRRPQAFVPVPLFYPIFSDDAYSSPADPYVPDPAASADAAQANSAQTAQGSVNPGSANQGNDELRAAYLQGAHDALTRREQGDSRYGEHYLDSRERSRQEAAQQQKAQASNAEFSVVPIEDKTPATVFIFKDGHQMETKNYAIMGGTLFDFSGKMLKKVQLDDLDSAATVKANDDRGVAVKLN